MAQSRASRRQEWFKKIKIWQASGDSITRWCRNNDVPLASFHYWRKRLADSELEQSQSVSKERLAFVELHSNSSSASPWLEIHARGLRIALERGGDIDALRHCLKLLLGLPC